ncbi:MAG: type II secretion system inner membrane protein GspF [Deltaproteobacteria bacterium]|nr:type II secretion system inner membrane protein GspF [Deltaproteobacteria bacterium]
MPVYEYTALDKAGKRVQGIVDADSPAVARQKLRGEGFFPTTVNPTASQTLSRPAAPSGFFRVGSRIKTGEIAVLTRQLATLLAAGIPLVEVLDAIISQAANPHLKKIMAQVKDGVTEGNSLAHAFSRHPEVFSSVYVNMVRAGEASGSLEAVLERLADFSEQAEALRGKVRAALAYPVFMLVIGSLILIFLMAYIVPDITRIFTEMDQVLPLPTRMLMGAAAFFRSFWWAFVLAVPFGALLWRRVRKSPNGARSLDKLMLTLPVAGPINRKLALARFGRTLAGLLHGGVSLPQALGIVRNVVNNALFAEAIDAAADEIQAGRDLASQLAGSRWFPPIAVQMISVGERSGDLDGMLNKMADITETEVETRITALTAMLEPVMILAMGLAVGFIVVSILLPLFEMNQLIR